MKLRDFASAIYINPSKLVDYALNPDHSRGGHKARVFRAALGYTIDNYQLLLNQIEELALDSDATVTNEDQFGLYLRVDLVISGVAGQTAAVRTGWIIASKNNIATLTTVFVLKDLDDDQANVV
jgi:hypothetical protein